MTQKSGYRVIAIYKEIYPEEPVPNIDSLLKGISKLTLLRFLSVLINMKDQQFYESSFRDKF